MTHRLLHAVMITGSGAAPIGEGGMGAVYGATDTSLGRQ
jgi:hypothetical protein